jgi:hypothetical protein
MKMKLVLIPLAIVLLAGTFKQLHTAPASATIGFNGPPCDPKLCPQPPAK